MNTRFPYLLSLAALLCSTPAIAEPTATARDDLIGSVDALSPRLDHMASSIWKFAEVGYQETKSAALLVAELKREGFAIDEGVAGMPTAFVARAGKAGGPVIAIIAEYDALPGVSQAAQPTQQTVAGQIAGHACGHHLFGAASVTAAIAIAKWLKATGKPGEVRVYGSPAEEGGGGKIYLAREGLFNDVDAVIAWHAAPLNTASASRTLAVIGAKFRFRGVAAHASGTPDQGRSALDGVEAMDAMVNQMREHIPPASRVHNVITHGGEAPNVVPAFAESYYMVRHPDPSVTRDIFARVVKAAEGAALGTGTTVDHEIVSGELNYQPSETIGRIIDGNLRSIGRSPFTAAQRDFAATLSQSLPGRTYVPGSETKIEPFRFGDVNSGSTDMGDVSWLVPTAGLSTVSWVPGTPPHSWQAVAAGGTSIGTDGAVLGAKTLALTAAELFERPELLDAARAELQKARGENWSYKPLLGDRKPPLDYRKSGGGDGESKASR